MAYILKTVKDKKALLSKSNCTKYLLFTLCFWLITLPILVRNFLDGNFMAGGSDAITQMYPVMIYTRRVIKEFISCLLSGQKYIMPMFDPTIGMGEDIIAALNFYGVNDPFYLFSIFFSQEQMPYFYSILFYLRVYLGGIAAICLFHEIDNTKKQMSYVAGALIYCFSGFTLLCNVHIIFVHAVFYTPLLLIGAERTFKGKNKGLITLTTFLFALSGFFFLYIASITLGVYVIYRTVTKYTKKSFYKIGQMILEYLIGLGMAAVIFIPAVAGFLSSSRSGGHILFWGFLPREQIVDFLENFFLPQYEKEQVLSVCVIGIMSIIAALFSKAWKHRVNIVLMSFGIVMPTASCIMSGFGGVYDRWEYVIILYIAYLTVCFFDNIQYMTVLQKSVLTVVWFIIGVYGKHKDIFDDVRYGKTILFYGVTLFVIVIVFPICSKIKKEYIAYIALFIVTLFSIGRSWNMVARGLEISMVSYDDNPVEELIESDKSNFRVDWEKTFSEPRLGMNLSFVLDYMGISEYFSIENVNYINAFVDWENGSGSHNNTGMDQRAVLETNAAVKYYVARPENSFLVPYGFEFVKASKNKEWSLYENKYALPMIYGYDKIYDKEKYNKLNGLQKQAVGLQAAAVENVKGIETLQKADFDLHEGSYTIDDMQGITISDGMISAEAGSVMTITAELKKDSENYLYFEDDILYLTVEIREGYEKYAEPITLGKVEEDTKQQIKITFERAEEFKIESMKILYYTFDNYEQYIDALKEGIDEESISMSTNYISCNTNFDTNKVVCTVFPYSAGWHAAVDGKEVEVFKVNSMYMGILADAGEHKIELYYITPGIRTGAVVSLISFMCAAVYAVIKYGAGLKKNK